MNTLVRIRELHKVYFRGSERIDVLQGVDLEIPEGDFLALMGPSGSGKTTLLNLMGGLDTPTEGAIEVAGDRIDKMSGGKLSAWRARHIGFVFQMYNLLPVLTAARNVELPLLLTKLSSADRKRRVQTALSVVGLADRAKHSHASCRAARNSASASPAPSSRIRRCCSATSRRAIRPQVGDEIRICCRPRTAARQDDRHGHARPACGGSREADLHPEKGALVTEHAA